MAFTIVPIFNLSLTPGTRIPFAKGFVFQDVPQWLKDDKDTLSDINRKHRQLTLDAIHAFVAEYEADCYGYPDPDWTGITPRSIQATKYEQAMLANMAIWLIQPSSVCFTLVFHALTTLNGQTYDPPFVNHTDIETPLFCHPNDLHNEVTPRHLIKAGELHDVLSTIPRKTAFWEALRAFWGALTMNAPDYRYTMFWFGLESLFGSDTEKHGVSRRIRERIASFIAEKKAQAESLTKTVETCYAMRSNIAHGRWETWKDGPEIEPTMADTEGIVRTTLRLLANKPETLKTFISPQRNDYLQQLQDSRRSAGWF